MIIITVISYFLLVLYEFIPLYKQKQWNDFWVNCALGICSFFIAILLSFGIKIPSPSIPIQEFVKFIFGKLG